MLDLWGKLIVALDLDDERKIKKAIGELALKVGKFKIGPVAFTRFGPQVVSWVKGAGGEVFLDFKFYDIPNTMIEAAKALVDLGVWAFTVHLKAGSESLAALNAGTAFYAQKKERPKPLIFGVTELTSKETSLDKVLSLAETGRKAGIEAVVCSVREAETVKKKTGLLTVTPGIRKKAAVDDQKRTASLRQAVGAGADYFVVGRPILKSDNFLLAAKELIESAGK